MAPDESRSRPGGNPSGIQNDLLTGDQDNHNGHHELASEIYAQATDVLLHLRAGDARSRLKSVPAEVFPDLCDRFVRNAVAAAVEFDDIDPHPLVVAEAARRAGIEAPPGWRGQVVSELADRYSKAPPPALAGWLFRKVQEQAVRRVAEKAVAAMAAAVWRGDICDLAEVFQAQAAAVVAMAAVVSGNG